MNVFTPSAQVVTHSILKPALGVTPRELITFTGNFHRYVLSEFNTHRSFSRNSASSRAVPVTQMIELAKYSRVSPIEWGLNQRGMSASKGIEAGDKNSAQYIWNIARTEAIGCAEKLNILQVHKQVINRILEPFLPHTVVFTCDRPSLQAFFALRISPQAQPEIREFAIAVEKAFNDSEPKELNLGQLHLPFVAKIYHWEEVFNRQTIAYDVGEKDEFVYSLPIFQSVATCARFSYLGHEKSQTDLSQEKLFWDLYKNRHMSTFEHVAVALSSDDKLSKALRMNIIGQRGGPRQNYTRDYLQLRKIIEKENLLFVDR